MTNKPPVLELSVRVDADPQAVWEALTDPSRLASWFPLHSEARPDNRLLLSWGSDCEWETHVTQAEPGVHLQWMDILPDQAEPGAILPVVDFYIESGDGGTTVRLVQSGFDPDSDWQTFYDGVRRGWSYFLDLLGNYLEHHFQGRRTMIWRRGRSRLPRAELWAALLGSLGLATSATEGSLEVGQWLSLTLGSEAQQAEIRLAEAPHVLAVRLPGLNEASLFIEMEPGDDRPSCGVWLSTYELPPQQLSVLEQRVDELCGDLLSAD